ncbi:MAG: hypothetical protein ABSA62_06025 [Methyloceanibacter sp.]|jgi:hypothetical protein
MLERAAAAGAEMGADRRHALRIRLKDGQRLRMGLAGLDRDPDPLARKRKGHE